MSRFERLNIRHRFLRLAAGVLALMVHVGCAASAGPSPQDGVKAAEETGGLDILSVDLAMDVASLLEVMHGCDDGRCPPSVA